jgi:hypothetical protein
MAKKLNAMGRPSRDAVAEAIVNNVRKTIIRDQLTDPSGSLPPADGREPDRDRQAAGGRRRVGWARAHALTRQPPMR